MAIVKLNSAFVSVRRKWGNLVLKRYGKMVVLSRKPVFRDRKFTASQKACQQRFREAAAFAKRLMADPRARAVYEEEARMKGKPARSLIMKDFLEAHTLQIVEGSDPPGELCTTLTNNKESPGQAQHQTITTTALSSLAFSIFPDYIERRKIPPVLTDSDLSFPRHSSNLLSNFPARFASRADSRPP